MAQPIIIITIVLVCISACGRHSDTVQSHPTIAVQESAPPRDNLKIARQFAEDFMPDTAMKSGMRKMNTFPDSVIQAFKALRIDLENQEKYLTLLYLKIYRGHLLCCHQSYELRVKPNTMGIDSIADPLLYEYNLITKQFDNQTRIEMIASGIAETWVGKNKRLLSDERIKEEYKIIQSIEKDIEKGGYW